MKRLFTILAMVSMTLVMFAQSPEKMSYQAVIRNSSNQLVTNQAVGMIISILQGTVTGTIVYQETYNPNPQTNANGLVSIEIGDGIPISGTFSGIDWSEGSFFLRTETDPTGGTDYSITGVSQILSVPYALYAETAGNGFSGNYEDLNNKPDFIGWDDNVSDDFSGRYNDLTNKPANLDEDKTDDVTLLGNQTIGGNKTFSNTIVANNGMNANNKNITNIAEPIESMDAVNRAYVDALLTKINELESLTTKVKDVDGNLYSTVKIGNQVWFTQNLKVTKLNDSTSIPLATDLTQYDTPAFYWYNNDELMYKNTYGALYNGYTVYTNKLCPTGWHVPHLGDWIELSDYLGGDISNNMAIKKLDGSRMTETGTEHWIIPNSGATNESGFTALPGGIFYDSEFRGLGYSNAFWSDNDYLVNTLAWYFSCTGGGAHISGNPKTCALSVRCLKD